MVKRWTAEICFSCLASRMDALTVFRGTVVHCFTAPKIEVLEDYLVGVDTIHGGKVGRLIEN